MRGFEDADPSDVGTGVGSQGVGDTPKRFQPPQPLPRDIAVEELLQLIGQEEAAAQQINARPAVRVF